MEEWKAIPGFPFYEVSSQGRVRRLPGGKCKETRILTPTLDPRHGRRYVSLCVKGRATKRMVAGLVAKAFLGPKPRTYDVHHIDENKANDALVNIEWILKAKHRSFHNSGERNNGSKLSAADVATIRALYPSESPGSLAHIFGVNRHTVTRIIHGGSWKEAY